MTAIKSMFDDLVHVGTVGVTHQQIGQAVINAFGHSAIVKRIEAGVLDHVATLNSIQTELQKAVALGGTLGLPAGSEAANVLSMANTALQAINSIQTILGVYMPAAAPPITDAPAPVVAPAGLASPA